MIRSYRRENMQIKKELVDTKKQLYEVKLKLTSYEGCGDNLISLLQKNTTLQHEIEKLKSELQELRLSTANTEIERELKYLEMQNAVNQKKRIFTEDGEFIITGEPKSFTEIVNIVEGFNKLPAKNPIKRVMALEEMLVFANSFEDGIDKLQLLATAKCISDSINSTEIESQIRGLALGVKLCKKSERPCEILIEQDCLKQVSTFLYSTNPMIKYGALRLIRELCRYEGKVRTSFRKYDLLNSVTGVLREGIFSIKIR